MIDPYKIIIRPVVTEKSYAQAHGTAWRRKGEQGQMRWYAFEVAPGASKHQIREAIVKLFEVDVTSVNILRVRSKQRRLRGHLGSTKAWKKAMIRVSSASKAIEGF